MQPDLQCDYEGTELEQLFVGLADGSLILDSAYVEYLLYDTLEYYTPGCPDLVLDPIVLERSYMLDGSSNNWGLATTTYFNYFRYLQLVYIEEHNTFRFWLSDGEIGASTNYDQHSYLATSIGVDDNSCLHTAFALPFPDSFELTENGIQGQFCAWGGYAEYLKVIPFWHEAE